jgi:1,4-alpha-glucan branching enzyme
MPRAVAVVDEHGHESDLQRIHDAFFNASMMPAYSRVGWAAGRDTTACARYGQRQVEIEDPYRFPPILSDLDLYLLGEGRHMHLYEKLGAHPMVARRRGAFCRLRTRSPAGHATSCKFCHRAII